MSNFSFQLILIPQLLPIYSVIATLLQDHKGILANPYELRATLAESY